MDYDNGRNNTGNNGRRDIPRAREEIHPVGQFTPRSKPPTTHTRATYYRQRSPSSVAASTDVGVGPLGLKEFLLNFRGRVSVSAYVVAMVGMVILGSLSFYILLPLISFLPGLIKFLVVVAFAFFLTWSFIALGVRRLHDLGHSGWWFLLCLIPLLNAPLAVYLGFWRGGQGENMFGAPAGSAPLPLAILCYPIFALTTLLNLLPVASVVPGINKVPGVRYLVPSSDMREAENVQQLVDAMPGVARDMLHLDKTAVKESIALVLSQEQTLGIGGFITEKRILIQRTQQASAMQSELAQRRKLQVKSLDKETHVTRLVASLPAKQWYVFELAQPIGKPPPLKDEDRNVLAAMGAFK